MTSRSSRRTPRARSAAWMGIEPLEQRVVLAAVAWDGGGGDNLWTNALNWDTDAVPGAGDDVTIPATALAQIVLTGNQTINSLDLAETLTIQAGSSLDVTAALNVTGNANLAIGGAVTWRTGTMSGVGFSWTNDTGTLTIDGDVTLNRSFLNAGNTVWSSGNITIGGTGDITNQATGTFTANSSGTMSGRSFINRGQLVHSDGGTTTTLLSSFNGDGGSVLVSAGTLALTNGTARGVYQIDPGATLNINPTTTFAHTNTTAFSGGGDIVLGGGGGAHTFAGTIDFGPGVNTLSATLQVNSNATFKGEFIVTVSSLTMNATTRVDGRLQARATSVLQGPADLRVSSGGELRVTDAPLGSIMTGAGTTRIEAGGLMTIDPSNNVYLRRALVNEGTINWSDGSILSNANGVLTNAAGGVINITSTGRFYGAGSITNLGTINRVGTATTSRVESTFSSTGIVNVVSGTLRLSGLVAQITGGDLTAGTWNLFGTLDVPSAQILRNFAVVLISGSGGSPALANLAENNGTITLSGGAGWAFNPLGGRFINRGTINYFGGNGQTTMTAALTNNGVFDVRSGRFNLEGGGNAGGAFVVRINATLGIGGFRYVMTGDNSLTGAGTVDFYRSGGAGPTHQIGGRGNHTVGTVRIVGASVNLQSDLIATAVLIDIDGNNRIGVLTGPRDLYVNGTLNWNAGSMTGTGTTFLMPEANTTLGGQRSKFLGRTLDNRGTVLWSGGHISFQGGALSHASGKVFTATGGGSFLKPQGFGGTFSNNGVFRKNGVGTFTIETAFNQNGTFNIARGVVSTTGSIVNTKRITIFAGAWEHHGATFTNAGILDIRSAGTVRLDGNFVQTEAATILFQIAGRTPTTFGSLHADGSLLLRGTVTVTIASGFVAQDGDKFELLDGTSRSGQFTTFNAPDLPGNLVGRLSYGAGSVEFEVDAE